MRKVVVTGSFDDLRSKHVRLMQEASKMGALHALLWPDEAVRALEGKPPKFPEEERLYLVQAMRYVREASLAQGPVDPDAIPGVEQLRPDIWAVAAGDDTPAKRAFAEAHGISYKVFTSEDLQGFPRTRFSTASRPGGPKKVVVTGCFDWLHSGHVRFFEEVSELGDLYVVVGNDVNVRFLKGEGHPLFSEDERRYMVQAVRYVRGALITSGIGWMDAEPEIVRLKPDIYAVNEDGDRPEKVEFSRQHNLEYVVLQRKPKEGLPRRESTHLRGF